jgi:hypothetical protein
MMKLLLLGALAVASLLLPTNAKASCTELTTFPVTISQPGVYCLAGPVVVNTATADTITIASSRVTVDCQGNSILNQTTDLAAYNSGIVAGAFTAIVVKNCTILGNYRSGIRLGTASSNTFYSRIQDNTIVGPLYSGIEAQGSDVVIRGNSITDIGGGTNGIGIGIRVYRATLPAYFIVDANKIAGVYGATGKAAYGIFGQATNSRVTGNLINAVEGGSAGYGVYIVAGTDNTLTDNSVIRTISISGPGYGVRAADTSTWCYGNELRGAPTATSYGCNASKGNIE